MIEQMKRDPFINDPFKYIKFIGLRTHGLIS